ncbi:Integrator complex subunit 3, partial [Linderina pennispora]
IIEVFAQSEAPVKAVSNVLAYALENFEPEDIETSAELIESGDLESVEHDILHTLFAVVASYTDRAPMSRDRLLDLLIQLTTAIPDIGFRWLLYAVNDAKRPLLYRDYVGRYAKGTLQAALARDMRLLQERFNMLFYNVLPCIYKAFPAEFPGNRIIVKSVVAMIDQPQVYRLNMLMARGELRLFGDRAAPAICGTTEYDAFEQVCLWQLVAGELAGDSVAVRKIARALLLTHELDPSMNSEAANGLLSLLRSVPPTKEILAVLVQKHVQGDDAADLCGSVMTA